MPRLMLAVVALCFAQSGQQMLTLEIRAFLGTEDVTHESRVIVHRAGERSQPVGQVAIGAAHPRMKVPAGIYDAQAVHEKDGRVVNIRWAERLVVMPYPDEAGHHLEVINFDPGYGALQIRGPAGTKPESDVALFTPGERGQPVAVPARDENYLLFVVRAAAYDVQARRRGKSTWHAAIEVPLDRTRLWVVP